MLLRRWKVHSRTYPDIVRGRYFLRMNAEAAVRHMNLRYPYTDFILRDLRNG